MNRHLDLASRPEFKTEVGDRISGETRLEMQGELLDDQDQDKLHDEGPEVAAQAHARPTAKRVVRERVNLLLTLRGEALGVERLRVVPELRVPMGKVAQGQEQRTRWEVVAV